MLSDLSDREVTGENIAKLWHGFKTAPIKATEQWYSEVKEYNFEKPELRHSTRHFTQMVWKGSKRFGMAAETTKEGEYTIVVALYDPPGNSKSDLSKNIQMPKSSMNDTIMDERK